MKIPSRLRCLLAIVVLGAPLLGCEGGRGLRITGHVDWDSGPVANSPEGAVAVLAWSWSRRDTTNYPGLLTADFEFVFAPNDTSGDRYLRKALTRSLELAAVRSLFVTGTDQVAAPRTIQFIYGIDSLSVPDPRPGRDPATHRVMVLSFLVRTEDPDFEVDGRFRMFLVRGDAAAWPPGVPHNPGADSSRWFLERWEEVGMSGLLPAGSASSLLPSGSTTLGKIKSLYLGSHGSGAALSQGLTAQ